MVLKRMQDLLNRRPGASESASSSSPDGLADPAAACALSTDEETLQGRAANAVRHFCESGGPGNDAATEEIQCLPEIVTAAESSPVAAAACAAQIYQFLSKHNSSRPHVQHNAIMLVRILADNPGPTFTRNIDTRFVKAVKDLLRNGRDPSVHHVLRQTLSALENNGAHDSNLGPLLRMWSKEQHTAAVRHAPRVLSAPPWTPDQQAGSSSSSHNTARPPPRSLPAPSELAARVEEAQTSATLLQQLVQSTPPSELASAAADNELIKEFVDRCQQAQRSFQSYLNIVADDHHAHHADIPTGLTLVATFDTLGLALSKYWRAVLAARGSVASAANKNKNNINDNFQVPSPPQHAEPSSSRSHLPAPLASSAAYATPPSPPSPLQPSLDARSDPFADSERSVHGALSGGDVSPIEERTPVAYRY